MPKLHRLSSVTGNADADYDIDLGAEHSSSILESPVTPSESPTSQSNDTWTKSGIAPTTDLPTKPREWRSASYSEKLKERQKTQEVVIDRDCGICFETSRNPRRTPCCHTLFCLEHISDWLNGPSSNGQCPACEIPLGMKNDTITLSANPHPQVTRASSYAPPPLASPREGPHESTVDISPIGEP